MLEIVGTEGVLRVDLAKEDPAGIRTGTELAQ